MNSGWLVLDKPEGISSTRALARVRKLLGIQKAGHAGTLDPFASGVLPVAFGEATKTVPYAMAGKKRYRFTIVWGESRDTDDATGETLESSTVRPPREAIEECLVRFTGCILQRPPSYSAVHVSGKRAYELARQGERPELKPRQVQVDSLRLLALEDGTRTTFEMLCGKGVYVRSIARDMGMELGCFGYAAELRRLASGPFTEDMAMTLDEIEKIWDSAARRENLLPVSTGLDDIPALPVTSEEARLLRRGQSVRGMDPGVPCGTTAWASLLGQPVAIGVVREGRLHPSRVFNLLSEKQE